MKYLLLLLAVLATGCANMASPFFSGDESLQAAGATKSSDPERELGAYVVTTKALRAGVSDEFVFGLAEALEAAAEGAFTNGALSTALESYATTKAKHPEDKALVRYFIAKLSVSTDRVALPLSPEQKRVLYLYSEVLVDTVREFRP